MTINRIASCSVCKTCTQHFIGKTLTASRSIVFSWVCVSCNRQQNSESGGIFISKTELQKWIPPGESHESIPIWKIKDAPRCSRCGDRGAELHHWAPKEIFGEDDAELWPKDYLCVTCHRDWHGKINSYRTAST